MLTIVESQPAAYRDLDATVTGPTHRGERVWLGDHQGLIAAAVAAGLSELDAAAVLSGVGPENHTSSENGYFDQLETGLQRAAQLGTRSVPLFAIGDSKTPTLLNGAVSEAELFAVLRQSATR